MEQHKPPIGWNGPLGDRCAASKCCPRAGVSVALGDRDHRGRGLRLDSPPAHFAVLADLADRQLACDFAPSPASAPERPLRASPGIAQEGPRWVSNVLR